MDYVHIKGTDLGVRWALNTRVNGGNRRYQDLNLNPANPTLNMSVGESKFDGVNFSVRRRLDKGISFSAWYSLAKATGLGGQGTDELTTNMVQDSTNPYADVQWGPSQRTDARHKISLSAVINMTWGIYVSPTFRYRSALPLYISTGYDVNADGLNNDIYTTAFQLTDVDDLGEPALQGHRRLHDDQLRARRGALAVQPARVEDVQTSIRHEPGSNRRRVQPLQRDQSELQRGRACCRRVLHRHRG